MLFFVHKIVYILPVGILKYAKNKCKEYLITRSYRQMDKYQRYFKEECPLYWAVNRNIFRKSIKMSTVYFVNVLCNSKSYYTSPSNTFLVYVSDLDSVKARKTWYEQSLTSI